MVESNKQKKKKPTFRRIEDGMVFETEDGEIIAVGFPTEVEKKTAGEGKVKLGLGGVGGEGGGEKYSKVKYNWHYLTGSPLHPEQMRELDEQITSVSGTVVAGSYNSSPSGLLEESTIECNKCKYLNPKSNEFCSNCGNPLT